VLLFCLAALALSSTPFADTLEAALTSPTGARSTPSSTLAARLQLVFGVVAPGAAVVWAFAGERVLAACMRVLGLVKPPRRASHVGLGPGA
jgi:hypothetical protein